MTVLDLRTRMRSARPVKRVAIEQRGYMNRTFVQFIGAGWAACPRCGRVECVCDMSSPADSHRPRNNTGYELRRLHVEVLPVPAGGEATRDADGRPSSAKSSWVAVGRVPRRGDSSCPRPRGRYVASLATAGSTDVVVRLSPPAPTACASCPRRCATPARHPEKDARKLVVGQLTGSAGGKRRAAGSGAAGTASSVSSVEVR
jgi:hypothetical protein